MKPGITRKWFGPVFFAFALGACGCEGEERDDLDSTDSTVQRGSPLSDGAYDSENGTVLITRAPASLLGAQKILVWHQDRTVIGDIDVAWSGRLSVANGRLPLDLVQRGSAIEVGEPIQDTFQPRQDGALDGTYYDIDGTRLDVRRSVARPSPRFSYAWTRSGKSLEGTAVLDASGLVELQGCPTVLVVRRRNGHPSISVLVHDVGDPDCAFLQGRNRLFHRDDAAAPHER